MSHTEQSPLTDFVDPTATHTEPITKTVVCPLETSRTKTERIEDRAAEWQEIAARMADMLASHRPSQWRSNQTISYQAMKREFPDCNGLKASVAQQAVELVAESYHSWLSNGRPSDNHPNGEFGAGSYLRLRQDNVTVAENDRGFGVKLGIVPYDPLWFHVDSTDYHDDYLARVADGDDPLRSGSAEVRLSDGGVSLHLTITEPIEVYDADGVERFVGVDLGERALYAAVAADSNSVIETAVESGREFRHHRERLQQKRDRLGRQGDLAGVRACRGERERYTDHVTHVASREIVDMARDHTPCGIAIEDLTNYRETADDAIHDWPFAELQTKVAYKATEAGIPVVTVDAAGTSSTCRQCGCSDPMNRPDDAVEFDCIRCGYQVHADVNAGINIATRAQENA